MIFANRVSKDDVRRFIKGCGFCVQRLKMKIVEEVSEGVTINHMEGYFFVGAYKFNFTFDDFDFRLIGIDVGGSCIKYFARADADITSNDWRCFLKNIFGDEYIGKYRFFNKSNEIETNMFISELSLDDIYTIVSKYENIQGVVREVEAFDNGTRRFKFFSNNAIREVIIAAYYGDSSVNGSIDEKSFIKFMYEKFGESFRGYYLKCIDREFDSITNETLKYGVSKALENERITEEDVLVKRCYEVSKRVHLIRNFFENTIVA